MATFEIDPEKVKDLTVAVAHALNGRRMHIVDIAIALTEVNGKLIAEHVDNPMAMRELATVCAEHLERTIRIGAARKGINMGGV